MTRVSVFIQKNDYRFESWEEASNRVKKVADDAVITVQQGRNLNYADIRIHCHHSGLTMMFGIYDLWQESSTMLDSIRDSVIEDYMDENYDYWDQLPPFGVVHLFEIQFTRQQYAVEEDIVIFFDLLRNFLLKHFMMYVFRESEMISPYMVERAGDLKTFTQNGQPHYRVK